MPWGPYFSTGSPALPADGAGKRYIDQVSWDATIDNFANWKAAVNGGGFTISNVIINTALAVTAGTTKVSTLQVQSTTADLHLYLSSVGPSIEIGNDPNQSLATTKAIIGLATTAGHYSLPNAGDMIIGTYGSGRGNIYINPNFSSGSGKSVLIYGLTILPNLPSVNPGAGFKQLWYDPADANRVKYAP